MKPKRTFWYVDSENVHSNFESIIPQMQQHDRVYFFYSEKSPYISFDILSKLAPKNLHYYFVPVTLTGYPNAMDFAMCVEMGRMSAEFPNVNHTFITNDNGFMAAVMAMRQHSLYSFVASPERPIPAHLSEKERCILKRAIDYTPTPMKNRFAFLNEQCQAEGVSYAALKPYLCT